MIIKNASVFTENGRFSEKDICIEGDFFTDSLSDETEITDAGGCYAIPGLVDIHSHGCDGVDFCEGTIDTIKKILAYEARNGITTIVPATMSLSEEDLARIARAAAEFRKNQNGKDFSYLYGINMEGPFVSAKKCGAQNTKYIRKPDIDMFNRLFEASEGCIRLCDIAPEEDDTGDFIREVSKKCRVSVAHTDADYETAKRAFDLGASHVTHLFNAMPALGHREPGPIAAALENDKVVAELICDGVHVAAPAIRAAFKMFGKERIAIISDSMMATGLGDGEYELGKQPVTVRGNEARLHDGTIAGSVTNLMGCLKYAVKNAGIPLEDAVYSATATPAKAVGCYDMAGSITPGKYADLVLLDKKTLDVKTVFVRGTKIYEMI
ncbi:MAG: N-acetylglucosamine-6-phosphate deacetylase [Butyrivibrio sp.]|nr:N-acetylglucosamine-6-phosphate deacetylase [Butyrivibrio sp.]